VAWSDPSFAAIADVVAACTGLIFPPARHAEFEQALERALPTPREPRRLLALLEKDDEVRETLVAELTVGETYFFRDSPQFTLLQDLLPRLATEVMGRPIRIWSAGCASGEEPYSVAILCDQLGLADRVAILGTDLSRARLAAARRGVYRPWSFRGVPPEVVDRYFERRGVHHHIRPDLRQRVEYRYLNLAEDRFPSLTAGIWGMDVILCRNVLIYFDRETISRVAHRLVDTLARDGYLVLGASDPAIGELTDTVVTFTTGGLIYRRRDAGPTLISGLLPDAGVPFDVASSPGSPAPDPRRVHGGSDEDRRDWRSADERQRASDPGGAPGWPTLDRAAGPPGTPSTRAANAAGWLDAPSAGDIAPIDVPAGRGEGTAHAGSRSPATGTGAGAEVTDGLEALAAAYRTGDYDRVHALGERLGHDPASGPAPWLFRIRAFANRGGLEDAGRTTATALERFGDSAELLYLHAVLLAQSGRHPEAGAAARRALYLDPELVVAYIALANARSRTGDRDGARRALRNAEVLLSRQRPDEPVPAADGQSAGRLKQLVRTHLALLAAA
jgi:chemotaxis protein methyltransferase CheR